MIRHFSIYCFLIVAAGNALAQSPDPLLFDTNEILELTMPVDFDSLCRPSETPDCDYTPTVFEYHDADGKQQTLPISIRRREGWRALKTNCQVPTIFVRFTEEDTVGTPFEGQTTLALTSHCGKGISMDTVSSRTLPDAFESYVGNEYLGYRLYNLLTDVSLRVRFIRITYVNPEDPRRNFTRNGFFAEHFDKLAERLGAQLLPGNSFDPARLDLNAADQMALFNFMIGNTDWSIEKQDNVFLLRFPDGRDVPVLYDLDMTGLVNAHYASPAPDLPIKKVKHRYYLGFCHPDMDWDALFAQFSGIEGDIMKMIAESPGLGRGDRRESGGYIDTFYDTLDSAEKRKTRIIERCRPMPPAADK
jgi:hypothetical protein